MSPENDAAQPAPPGLDDAGVRLWEAICGPYELDEHELVQLHAACRTADLLDRLSAEIDGAGSLVAEGKKGDPVAHPAAVEHRQQSITLSRLLAALRLPAGEESDRPQRRGGARAPYSRRGEVRALRSTS